LAWYDPSWLYRQKITLDHTLVAEDLTDFPGLITDAVVQASLFTHARSDGADIVVTAGNETTRLKRELVTYDALTGKLELYVNVRACPRPPTPKCTSTTAMPVPQRRTMPTPGTPTMASSTT
jgi:hypothetical protein